MKRIALLALTLALTACGEKGPPPTMFFNNAATVMVNNDYLNDFRALEMRAIFVSCVNDPLKNDEKAKVIQIRYKFHYGVRALQPNIPCTSEKEDVMLVKGEYSGRRGGLDPFDNYSVQTAEPINPETVRLFIKAVMEDLDKKANAL